MAVGTISNLRFADYIDLLADSEIFKNKSSESYVMEISDVKRKILLNGDGCGPNITLY